MSWRRMRSGLLARQSLPFAELVDSDEQNPGSATHTFVGMNFGDPGASRILILGVTSRDGSGGNNLASVTIGGVSASEVISTLNDGSDNIIALWLAFVPTGTSGDVVLNFDATQDGLAVTLIRAINITNVTDTDAVSQGHVSSIAGSIVVQDGGIVIGCAYMQANTTSTWANLTEITDFIFQSNNHLHTSALQMFETGQTVEPSVTWGSSNDNALVLAAFR